MGTNTAAYTVQELGSRATRQGPVVGEHRGLSLVDAANQVYNAIKFGRRIQVTQFGHLVSGSTVMRRCAEQFLGLVARRNHAAQGGN